MGMKERIGEDWHCSACRKAVMFDAECCPWCAQVFQEEVYEDYEPKEEAKTQCLVCSFNALIKAGSCASPEAHKRVS